MRTLEMTARIYPIRTSVGDQRGPRNSQIGNDLMPPTPVETLLRELVAGQAAHKATLEGLGRRVDGVQSDAREARDAARDSLAQTKAQDLPAKLAEFRGHVESGFQASRSDLVNAMSKITTEARTKSEQQDGRLHEHDKRINDLEAFRDKLRGAGGLAGWLSRYAPWFITGLFAAMAAVGIKGQIHL